MKNGKIEQQPPGCGSKGSESGKEVSYRQPSSGIQSVWRCVAGERKPLGSPVAQVRGGFSGGSPRRWRGPGTTGRRAGCRGGPISHPASSRRAKTPSGIAYHSPQKFQDDTKPWRCSISSSRGMFAMPAGPSTSWVRIDAKRASVRPEAHQRAACPRPLCRSPSRISLSRRVEQHPLAGPGRERSCRLARRVRTPQRELGATRQERLHAVVRGAAARSGLRSPNSARRGSARTAGRARPASPPSGPCLVNAEPSRCFCPKDRPG